MRDRAPGIGKHLHVLVGQPHAVRADEAGTEEPVRRESRDDALPPAPPALDDLHLGLGQVRVHADAVLAHQPTTPIEELVGRLVGDRRRHRDAHAALGRRVEAPNHPLRQLEQPFGRRRADRLDARAQIVGQQREQSRHRLVEDDVGHRGREHHAHADVGVRAHRRLERLVGDRRHGHVEVVRRGAAGFEHFDGADGRRQVVVLGRPEAVVRRRVGQKILERPVAGAPAREVTRGVRVSVAEPRQQNAARRIEHARVGGRGECRAHGGNAIAVDQHIGA